MSGEEYGSSATGPFGVAPIVEVLIVGLGIYLHLLVEALLLVNVAIGAFSLIILSLLTFSHTAKEERRQDQDRPNRDKPPRKDRPNRDKPPREDRPNRDKP